MTVAHGVNSSGPCETYLVCLLLPHRVAFSSVRAIKGDLHGGADVLIGMDIITQGDFSVTNKGGVTVFSFRMPSELSTDYVQEHSTRMAKLAPPQPMRGFRPGHSPQNPTGKKKK